MILKITFPYKTHRLESLGETQPHLVFLEKEIERGRQALEMMGLNPDKPFVCIYARDSAYLEKMYPDRNWSYHDYRDQSIEDFRQAVLYLLEQGYSVIRMGKIVKDTFDVDHPDFIDYSNSKYCSDFLDIFLPAHCAFFVGSPSGLVSVPQIFRRPIAYVDFCCPRAFYYWDLNDSRAIFIWKKVFDKVEKRILTFAETIQYNMPESLTNPDMPLPHDRSRYQIVNNSANEIMKLCEEMHLRLNDQWSLTDDHDLQKQLKDLYPNNVADDLKFNRMGYAFIKEHAHLMNADHPVSTTS